MNAPSLEGLATKVGRLKSNFAIGRVREIEAGILRVAGLSRDARMGDRMTVHRNDGSRIEGEVLRLNHQTISILPDEELEGIALDDRVRLIGEATLAPDTSWIGRVIDPLGRPLDGRPLSDGPINRDIRGRVLPATSRRPMGQRLDCGLAALNTLLPIVQGQRIGLFAGSGVGKSSLLGQLARKMQADVVVIGLVGERGREVREFVDKVLGASGMERTVVVAATSDRSPLVRRRCAWSAMTVAEHFREMGAEVLLLTDSITRFAEAHREVAISSGEMPAMRGFPASTSQTIMSLCERAGPGTGMEGNITAIFSVLVAGSDMDEPVADILRGTLDGHFVLDRAIAERGRFPAIDLLRSVSRSLPDAASEAENKLIAEVRNLIAAYESSETMIKAGLYQSGSDPIIDHAIRAWPELDKFLSDPERLGIDNSFARLEVLLRRVARSDTREGGVGQRVS